MSEVKRYTATELRFSTTASGDFVTGTVFDELRQQLADVTNDRNELRKQREAILMQARVWAGEAKTQRSTVESVGAILGGIPDWGPIAAGVEALKDRLNASEARNAGERDRLIDAYQAGYCDGQNNPNGYSSEETRDTYIAELLAQSAPATDERSGKIFEARTSKSAKAPEGLRGEQIVEVHGGGFQQVARVDCTDWRHVEKWRIADAEPATDEQGAGA